MEDHRQWIKLVNKVFENKHMQAEAVFVHGWGDLCEELLEFAAKVFKESGARLMVLNGEETYDNRRDAKGFSYWCNALVSKYGVPESAIRSYLPGKNTGDEAKGYIDTAKKEGIKSALVVSVPQHIFRAFLTDLGLALKEGITIKLTPRTLTSVDWEEEIEIQGLMGKDDVEITTRLGRVFSECVRVIEYRKRYEKDSSNFVIASVEEGLEHLN